MKDTSLNDPKRNGNSPAPAQSFWPISIVVFALLLVLLLVCWQRMPPEQTATADIKAAMEKGTAAGKSHSFHPAGAPAMAVENPGTVKPHAMQLTRKVLVDKKWNSGPDAFGLSRPPEGKEAATLGPTSLLFAGNTIYVRDDVNNRILCYDKEGRLLETIPLREGFVRGDLVANPSDSSVLSIDYYGNTVSKLHGAQAEVAEAVSVLGSINLGSKFEYDAASETLFARDFDMGGDVAVLRNGKAIDEADRKVERLSSVIDDVQDGKMILDLKNGPRLEVPFERPVDCIRDTAIDRNGIMWVLFTLEGDVDQQIRRLARVDPIQGTVGVATVEVSFTFDAVRRLTATDTGAVLLEGDEENGRLISYDYPGVN